jgi:hypothetical protein
MKKFLFYLISLSIAGFACFAVLHWIFKRDFKYALGFTIVMAFFWIVFQLVKEYLGKRKRTIE